MESEQVFLKLVDEIYDAASDPDLWPRCLRSLQKCFRLENIVMGLTDLTGKHSTISLDFAVDFDPKYLIDYNTYFCQRNVLLQRGMARQCIYKGNLLVPNDYFSHSEWTKSEIYNDWARPQNIFWAYAPVLAYDEQTLGMLSLARNQHESTFPDDELALLRMLTPHLVRAVALYIRIGALENFRSVFMDAADRFAEGIVFINGAGVVVTMNDSAKQILDQNDGLSLNKEGRFHASKREDTASLQRLISEASTRPSISVSTSHCRDLGAISLTRPSGKRNYALLVCPARLDARYGRKDHAHVVVFIDDPERAPTPPAERLKHLFGLTRSEAEVAAALCHGQTLEQIAEEQKRSKNTVKTLLQRVFHKTGTSRQGELISLLMKGPFLHEGCCRE